MAVVDGTVSVSQRWLWSEVDAAVGGDRKGWIAAVVDGERDKRDQICFVLWEKREREREREREVGLSMFSLSHHCLLSLPLSRCIHLWGVQKTISL